MIKNKPQTIFKTKDIIIFSAVFITLFVLFFSKSILINNIKKSKNLSEQSIFYIEKINSFLHDEQLNEILLKAYIRHNNFKKALVLIKELPENFKNLKLATALYEKLYFTSKNKKYINKINKLLTNELKYAKNKKDFEYIYKKALSFGLIKTEYIALKNLKNEYPEKYIQTALYLKKYKEVFTFCQNRYKKTKKTFYLIKALQSALWQQNKKNVLDILNENTDLTDKEKNIFLQAAVFVKDKKSVKKYFTKSADINTRIQAYLLMKQFKKAYALAKKKNDLDLMAKTALWAHEYKKAQKLYKKLYRKNKKKYANILFSLAIVNHDYPLIEKTLKEEIKKGNLKKIPELVTIFTYNFHLEKGGRFFEKMYRKFHSPKLLKAAFTLYETEGNINKMISVAKQLKTDITPYIAIKVSRIYLGQKEINKSYKILKTALIKHPRNLSLLKNLYDVETYLNINSENTLKRIIKLKPSQYYVVKLADVYISQNRLKKALRLLNKHSFNSPYYNLTKLFVLYRLRDYKKIINYSKNAPEYMKGENYFWYLYINSAKKLNKNLKPIYESSFKYTDFYKNDYYWYLINKKDKSITNYLGIIKNPKIKYSAYLMLHNYKQAYNILNSEFKNKNDYSFLINSYYLIDKIEPYGDKIRFFIYKKLKKNLNLKHKIPENIFEIYFDLSLKYASVSEITKLLSYAKLHYKNQKKYSVLYNAYFGHFEKLEYMEKK